MWNSILLVTSFFAYLAFHYLASKAWSRERRHLINELMSKSATELTIRQAATAEPKERTTRPNTEKPRFPLPEGL